MRCAAAGVPGAYAEPATGEPTKKARERRKQIEVAMFEHTELERPALRAFLEGTLGNLPLSVALCGHMFQADPALRTVQGMIGAFDTVASSAARSPTHIDRHGASPQPRIR